MARYYDVVLIMPKQNDPNVRTASGCRGEWFVHVRPCPECHARMLTDHHGSYHCNLCGYHADGVDKNKNRAVARVMEDHR